ncbi:MAG: 30S ribosomal protein S20 [Bauldia sp.]|nr:30S ribosomal protein S20 [Bauldia sp.]
MANTSSAKKAARQTEKRTAVNRIRRSRVRSFLRKVEEAIASGNKDAATASLREAESELMRAAGKGVFHKKAASRKVSRLTARLRAI